MKHDFLLRPGAATARTSPITAAGPSSTGPSSSDPFSPVATEQAVLR